MGQDIEDVLEFNYLLHACARIAKRLCDRYLSEMGCELEYYQFLLLKHVDDTKNDSKLSMTSVAKSMSIDRTTFNRNANILAKAGMLVKDNCDYNNRAKVYHLTEKGKKCLRDNIDHLEAASQIIYELSSLPKSIKQMRQLLIELGE